jgi:quercetin dioxygenase-like cupin family protein
MSASIYVVRQEHLPFEAIAREFIGERHGADGISFLLVDAEPGQGVALHRHTYDEVVIVQQGKAIWTVDGDERVAQAGDVLVVRAGQAHRFVNVGTTPLRQVDIHASARFITEWLDEVITVSLRRHPNMGEENHEQNIRQRWT